VLHDAAVFPCGEMHCIRSDCKTGRRVLFSALLWLPSEPVQISEGGLLWSTGRPFGDEFSVSCLPSYKTGLIFVQEACVVSAEPPVGADEMRPA
jgi:hypothetical protein